MTFLKMDSDAAMPALRNTTFIYPAILFWGGGYLSIEQGLIDVDVGVMHSVVLGSIVGIMIGLVTEYYTGIEPVLVSKLKQSAHRRNVKNRTCY